jgi:hypothetical protein
MSQAAAAGIEPASDRLTAGCLYQHRLHRIAIWLRKKAPAGLYRRLASETQLLKSTQRESNPHFRPGKAAGCRYIMGACFSS